ncbi:MAG: PHP domain-containing protein [Chloroflexi bacterium]|nr:PHP domain-containing protein [Chloroflexota bacterium]
MAAVRVALDALPRQRLHRPGRARATGGGAIVTDPTPPAPRLGRADLHLHTLASDGTASAEEMLLRAARLGLDVVAVTDHDDLRGALRAQEAAARLDSPVQVVAGVELTTRGGHLLALFPGDLGAGRPTPDVSPLRSLAWTIAAIHAQGGVAIVPHPMSWIPPGAKARAIDRLMAGAAESRPDGIELANPTPPAGRRSAAARRWNRGWGLAETGSSDAHFPEVMGAALTRFPGRTVDDLMRALTIGATVAEWGPSPSWRQIGARRLLAQQGRSGLATPLALARRALGAQGDSGRDARGAGAGRRLRTPDAR